MVWFLIVVLTLIALLAVLAIIGLASYIGDEAENERARIESEVRRAERKLHDIARDSFQAMLEEARAHGHGRVTR